MMVLRVPITPIESSDPADDLDEAGRRRRATGWLGGLAAVLVVTVPLAVGIGPALLSPTTVIQITGHHVLDWPHPVSWSAAQDAIVWQVRAPRVLLGAVVGAALAVAGVALQAMVRNVLADPYLLGVTSGASTGAAAALLFGVGAGFGASAVTASAFLGALGAAVAVFLIARAGGRVTSIRLLLAGVAVGYILYAATSFLVVASGSAEGARSVQFWLLGSLALATWPLLGVTAAALALALAVLLTPAAPGRGDRANPRVRARDPGHPRLQPGR